MTYEVNRGFVVGPENRVAATLALAMAAGDEPVGEMLLVSGNHGRGKTRLLDIAEEAFMERWPARIVTRLRAQALLADRSLLRAEPDYDIALTLVRDADLLMIDDFDLIARQPRIQAALAYAIDILVARRARIIVTSSDAMGVIEVRDFQPRLLSRLYGAVSADLGSMSLDMRAAIIRETATRYPAVSFSDALIDSMALHLPQDGRIIAAAVQRIAAHTIIDGVEPDSASASRILANSYRLHSRVTVAEIQRRVAEHFHIPEREMTSARRAREVARPRQVAMFLAKELTPKSLPDIGRRFGGRDHTTVIHAVKQITRLCAVDAEMDLSVSLLRSDLSK